MGRFRSLDLNLLRVFDVVMEERSLTKAAHRLALTQPAVSNALRRLRETLEDELLVRLGQGIEPTARALELWPVVRDALKQLKQTIEPETFNPISSDVTFILGMSDATAFTLMPQLARITEKEAPHASIRVIPLSSRDPRKLLDATEIDLAVGHFPAVIADLTARAQSEASVAYEARALYQREYRCVMSARHPWAHQELSLARYCAARHLLVSFAGTPYGFIDEALAAHGYHRQVVMTVNQYLTAARIVAQTELLTALPQHYVAPSGLARQLTVRELPVAVAPVSVNALWLKQHRYPSALLWLLDALVRAARQVS